MKTPDFKEDPFYPVQPFFVLNTEHYYKKQCDGDAVSHYYSFRAEKNHPYADFVIPDNAIDLLFCCNPHDASQTEKERKRLEARNQEIDGMFLSLYTDKTKGTLTEQRFMKLTAALEQEQEVRIVYNFVVEIPEIAV